MPWAVSLLLALQLVVCSALALREAWRARGADRVVLTGVAAVMLAMTAGAVAGL